MRNIYQVASIFLYSDKISQIWPGYTETKINGWGNEILNQKIENTRCFEQYTDDRY